MCACGSRQNPLPASFTHPTTRLQIMLACSKCDDGPRRTKRVLDEVWWCGLTTSIATIPAAAACWPRTKTHTHTLPIGPTHAAPLLQCASHHQQQHTAAGSNVCVYACGRLSDPTQITLMNLSQPLLTAACRVVVVVGDDDASVLEQQLGNLHSVQGSTCTSGKGGTQHGTAQHIRHVCQ